MRWMRAGVALLIALPFAGCGASEEDAGKLLQELVDNFNELSSTMATIQDGPSAKAANPKIKAIFDKLKDVKARDKKVTNSTKEALTKKFEKPLTDAGFKVGMELARIRQIPAAAAEANQVQEILTWMSTQK